MVQEALEAIITESTRYHQSMDHLGQCLTHLPAFDQVDGVATGPYQVYPINPHLLVVSTLLTLHRTSKVSTTALRLIEDFLLQGLYQV